MKKRQIGNSSLFVSPISYGCMSLGTEEGTAETLIKKALEIGITHFDTADLYDQGRNEELVGKFLHSHRLDVTIATKVGNRFERGKEGWEWAPTKPYILSQVEESLKRLNTDYIDLYQLHGGTLDDPIDDIIEAFEQLKAQGKIRAYGISSIRPNVIHTYLKKASIDSVMMQYSLLDRRPEELLDTLHAHNVSVIARGPLAKGLLTTKGDEKRVRAFEDGYLSYTGEELQNTLKKLTDKWPDTLTEHTLAYPLHHPAVACVIPGASNTQQLTDIGQANTTLTTDQTTWLQSQTKNQQYQQYRS
ncbi:aldo/keto reductase [Aureibacillus halotolerans]|uniref:Aryl-alcohol dehydrogenase-like predicted oxidoreductase n=1 Tax=Aureibacillus halotolerans TaxID=1508390 RepID=A0A4R6UEU2_9BACI|nr:aldo/keto reductase [Aureibacillus halotolerans]TDQ41614.1 aryl-alcohol dehydrogenase-like predicted oxidoreductase [Aureibacillus halotolerans]